jgi:hypothetical protein
MAVACKKVALAVLVAVAVSAQAVEDYINLPNANFQNYYKCSGDLETLAPKSVEGIQQAVRRASHVQGKGAGHSWCAPELQLMADFCHYCCGQHSPLSFVPTSPAGTSSVSAASWLIGAMSVHKLDLFFFCICLYPD